MENFDVAKLVDEILAALDAVGQLESWVQQHMDGSVDGALLNKTCREVTQRLLGVKPPKTAHWEHFLVATAIHSAKSTRQHGYEVCKTAIAKLNEMIPRDSFIGVAEGEIMTLASALSVALTAQSKLRQPIEATIALLCEKFPDYVPDMAERCQDIWQRHGQMSGAKGLYVWDIRNNEWRLSQDFKPYRPDS